MLPSFERLDDDHAPTAAWTWRPDVDDLLRFVVSGWWCDGQQRPHALEAGFPVGAGKQSIMADAVEPARQDVEQQAADEPIGRASCRDRVCQYVSISVVAVSLKKKKKTIQYE